MSYYNLKVFGSVNFIQILFIPVFGKYLNKLRAHRLFLGGVFVCGAANIVFGFLQWVDDTQTFLALSFIIRIISAIGEAAFLTSLYPLATKVSTRVVNIKYTFNWSLFFTIMGLKYLLLLLTLFATTCLPYIVDNK